MVVKVFISRTTGNKEVCVDRKRLYTVEFRPIPKIEYHRTRPKLREEMTVDKNKIK